MDLYSPEEILYELADYTLLDGQDYLLSVALSYLPKKIVDFAIKNCVFVSTNKLTNGIHLDAKDFRFFNEEFNKKSRKKSIIFLSYHLWKLSKKTIAFVIAHEISHSYNKDYVRSTDDLEDKEKLVISEKRADQTAVEWLKPHWSKTKLKHLLYKKWQLS